MKPGGLETSSATVWGSSRSYRTSGPGRGGEKDEAARGTQNARGSGSRSS